MIITGTYDLVVNPQWRLLQLQEIYLECDTTLAPVTINLFPIEDLSRFWNVKIYVNDISDNAGTNPITINTGASGLPLVYDNINRQGIVNFTINYNGGGAILSVVGKDDWAALSQTYVQAYSTIQDEGFSLPQRSILNFTGAGVNAFDNAGKTEVNITGVSSGNFGLFAQTALSAPITNTTAELSLIGSGVGTLSVPPNSFQVGDSFLAKMCGYLNSANNETIHIRVKSNGVVIGDAGVFTLNITTNKYFELLIDFTVTKIGGLGVAELFVNGAFSYNKNANSNIEGTNFALIDSTAFDTTILNNLTITAQWGSAKIANSIQSQNFVLNKIY
jgi:hypothetical protein